MANSTFKKWFLVILLAIGGGTVFKSMYLREVFYYPWNEFMGVNNTESGLLMSWLGFVGIVAGSIAGVIVDKINNTRLVITLTFMGVGVVTLWQSTAPGLATQYVIIGLLSFLANDFFLVSMVKAVRLVGDSNDQGKLFGFLESGRGVAGSIISAIAVAIFSMAASEIDGIGTVLYCYGFLYIVLGVFMWIFLPKNEDRNEEQASDKKEGEKISSKVFFKIIAIKEVWFGAIAIFATITCYQGTSYLVPYLTDAYGMSADQAGIVGMIRAYVLAIFAAPVIGIIVDKVKSSIKVMTYLFLFGTIGVGLFLVIPQNHNMVWPLIICLMAVGAITFALRGIMYAQIDEMKVPARITGTVTGILLTVGFSPEVFVHTIFGYWLDTYKMQGYNYMFIYMAVMFAIAICTSIMLYRSVRTSNPFKQIEELLASNK